MNMKSALFFLCLIALVLATMVKGEDEVKELQMETVKNGDCSRKSKKGDKLQMHYAGTLMDGKEFDSSYKRGSPFKFQLGAGMVIKGWDQGLLDMCKGEIRNLVIPYDMAYGESGYPPVIPEKANLKFKVELLDFDDSEDEL